MMKVHLCTFLSFACQVKYVVSIQVGPVMKKSVESPVFLRGGPEYSGNALFLFFITREGERRGVHGARWWPIGSSYPLDDVYGALPSAAEHTALKEVFFPTHEKVIH